MFGLASAIKSWFILMSTDFGLRYSSYGCNVKVENIFIKLLQCGKISGLYTFKFSA
jgi:hypothetical protein